MVSLQSHNAEKNHGDMDANAKGTKSCVGVVLSYNKARHASARCEKEKYF
jgi:hypothetical protein